MITPPAPLLTPEVVESASRSVLCWLATVDASGQPNVSPKEIFTIFDGLHLVIANIASPTSVRNIDVNALVCALVCVSFINVLVQKGFKVMGTARNIPRGDPAYAEWARPLLTKAGPRFPIHSVIVVQAQTVEPIVAPSYRLYPDTATEQSQMEAAL